MRRGASQGPAPTTPDTPLALRGETADPAGFRLGSGLFARAHSGRGGSGVFGVAREQFPPPEGLDGVSRGLWRRTRGALIAQDCWRPSDVPLVERYVRSMQTARHARERLAAGGLYVTEGSQGQLVQHPDVETAQEAERDAHEYAGALLLTPASRSRHGVVAGDRPPGRLAAVLSLAGRDGPGAA